MTSDVCSSERFIHLLLFIRFVLAASISEFSVTSFWGSVSLESFVPVQTSMNGTTCFCISGDASFNTQVSVVSSIVHYYLSKVANSLTLSFCCSGVLFVGQRFPK